MRFQDRKVTMVTCWSNKVRGPAKVKATWGKLASLLGRHYRPNAQRIGIVG